MFLDIETYSRAQTSVWVETSFYIYKPILVNYELAAHFRAVFRSAKDRFRTRQEARVSTNRSPYLLLSFLFGIAGLIAGVTYSHYGTNVIEPTEVFKDYDAVYRAFYEFPRPNDSMLTGFLMCRVDNCMQWEIRARFVTDQTAKGICEYYQAASETEGWALLTDPGCDIPTARDFLISGDLPAYDNGTVVHVSISTQVSQGFLIPARFYSEALRLDRPMYDVQWTVKCDGADCP